jgi:hypothetical protein
MGGIEMNPTSPKKAQDFVLLSANEIYLFLCKQEQDDRPFTKENIAFCQEFDCDTIGERLIKQAAELGIAEGVVIGANKATEGFGQAIMAAREEGRRQLADEIQKWLFDYWDDGKENELCIASLQRWLREILNNKETAKAENFGKN